MRYLLGLIFGLSLTACDKKTSNRIITHGPDVELSEVSGEQCFNIEKYFQVLRSMAPSMPVRYLTTDFEARAAKNNSIGGNFKLRSAYQSFFIEDTTMNEVSEIRPLVQADCETVTYMLNGIELKYKITAKGPNFLTLEDDFEEKITYQWDSKNTMQIKQEFLQGDLNCNDKSKASLIVTRELAWGDPRIVRAATIPQGKITDRYLTILSEATNYPKNNLYVGSTEIPGPDTSPFPLTFIVETQPNIPPPTPENPTLPEPTPVEEEPGPAPAPEPTEPPVAEPTPAPGEPPGERADISVAKLREMLDQPLRPELLRCN